MHLLSTNSEGADETRPGLFREKLFIGLNCSVCLVILPGTNASSRIKYPGFAHGEI